MKGKIIMEYIIEGKYNVNAICEISVSVCDYNFLVIYGKHINGYFCCIPNVGWGCEMSNKNDIFYNTEKLIECGADEETAKNIAQVHNICKLKMNILYKSH